MESINDLKIAKLEEENRKLSKDMEEVKARVLGLELGFEKNTEFVAYKFDQIMSTLDKLDAKIDELNNVPKNRWELIVTTFVTALATAAISAFIIKK